LDNWKKALSYSNECWGVILYTDLIDLKKQREDIKSKWVDEKKLYKVQ
jgi:hypothetical protein